MGNMLKSLVFYVGVLVLVPVCSAGCDDGSGDDIVLRDVCGDGKVDPGEECDSGILVGRRCKDFGYRGGTLNCTQQCTYDFSGCTSASCGDGIQDSGEECDDGAANTDAPNAACRPDCTLSRCGDGVTDDLFGEECDDGTANTDAPNAACRPDCTLSRCGDGVTDDQYGEVCDDGNNVSGDGCSADCHSTEFCGNGIMDDGEECDDGTANTDAPNAACRPDCTLPRCGDGVTDDLFGEECDDGTGTGWDGCSGCSITEFQVNGFTANIQERPQIVMGPDGRIVVVWQSLNQDGDGYGIFARLYDASGTPDGTEFRVNTYSPADQSSPQVAMGPGGRFVVVWQSYGQDGDGEGIYARVYDAPGTPDGTEFRVNSTTEGYQWFPAVAMGPDGRFVVVWQGSDGDGEGIYARLYDAPGTPDGTEFRVNSEAAGLQHFPAVAMGTDGRFVIVWQASDGSSDGVFARLYAPSGTPDGTEFQVNTHTSADQSSPDVAVDSTGRIVVVWHSQYQDGSGYGVYARIFDPALTPDGTEFQVNTYTSGDQKQPSVTMTSTGRFAVVWQSDDQDGDRTGIFAQRYTPAGTTLGLLPWP